MNGHSFRRNLANFFQRNPWMIDSARRVWRVGQAKFTVGVVGVIINPAGEVLLVEHVFHPKLRWGLPGGWVEANEDPALTLKRELMEELELESVVHQVLLASVQYRGHLDLAYICTAKGEIGALSSELLDYRWVTPAELPPLHEFQYRAVQQALALRNMRP